MVKMVLTVSSQLTDSESYILYYLYVDNPEYLCIMWETERKQMNVS